MAGKELDPARKQAALAVIREHPGLVAAMTAPALVVIVVAFVIAPGLGVLALIAFGVLGAVGVSRLLRRR